MSDAHDYYPLPLIINSVRRISPSEREKIIDQSFVNISLEIAELSPFLLMTKSIVCRQS